MSIVGAITCIFFYLLLKWLFRGFFLAVLVALAHKKVNGSKQSLKEQLKDVKGAMNDHADSLKTEW